MGKKLADFAYKYHRLIDIAAAVAVYPVVVATIWWAVA